MACVISEFKMKIAVLKLSVVFTLAQVDVKISQKLFETETSHEGCVCSL